MMELALGAAHFFTEFPDARIADGMSESDMFPENYFLIAPRSHRCMVVI